MGLHMCAGQLNMAHTVVVVHSTSSRHNSHRIGLNLQQARSAVELDGCVFITRSPHVSQIAMGMAFDQGATVTARHCTFASVGVIPCSPMFGRTTSALSDVAAIELVRHACVGLKGHQASGHGISMLLTICMSDVCGIDTFN